MYFIPYLFNHVYVFIGCDDFISWLGLACMVLFIIITVHSYVAPTLNKLIYLSIYLFYVVVTYAWPLYKKFIFGNISLFKHFFKL